ncbi:MAG: fimbrillin family protein [Rikenellaceae bacterium]
MKKRILFAIILTAIMSACSKNEVTDININNSNTINFSTYVTTNTKNEGLTSSNITNFGVIATSTKDDLTNQYMPNIYWYKNNGNWMSYDNFYWPTDINKSLYFYAYYPYYYSTSLIDETDNKTVVDFPDIYPNANWQSDIVVATASKNIKEARADNQPVELNFEHVLSKIGFEIYFHCNNGYLADDYNAEKPNGNYYDDENDDRITLFYNVGTLGFVNVKGSHKGLDLVKKEFIVDDNSELEEYRFYYNDVINIYQASSEYSGVEAFNASKFFLLPQELTPSTFDSSGKLTKLGTALKIDLAIEQFGHFIVGSYKGESEYDNTKYSNIDKLDNSTYYSDFDFVTAYLPIYFENYGEWKKGESSCYRISIDFDKDSIYLGYDKDGNLILDDDDKLTLSVSSTKWDEDNDNIVLNN